MQSSASASLFFEWESAKAEDSGAPLYEVVFDKEGGVMLLLKLIFHRQDTQELLKKLLEREKPETP